LTVKIALSIIHIRLSLTFKIMNLGLNNERSEIGTITKILHRRRGFSFFFDGKQSCNLVAQMCTIFRRFVVDFNRRAVFVVALKLQNNPRR
jgi:hypothetical protein